MEHRSKYPSINAECARMNLSRSELARMLGVTRKTFANWQSGKTEIPASAIIAMAEMWNVSADYILGLTRNP